MNTVQGVQDQFKGAMDNVELDEATRHEDCPEDVKGATIFKMKSGFSSMTSNAKRVFRMDDAYNRCDFKDAQEGVDKTVHGETYTADGLKMFEGVDPDVVRPSKIRKVDQYCQPECPCCNMTKRFTQAWLVAVGFVISFGIRCNVGVATVKMMANATEGNSSAVPEFSWTPETVGFVDSSFFWGYIVTQIPGGFLAARYSPTRLFGTAIFLSSCLNLFLPVATNLSPVAVIIVRVCQGLVEGVTYPSVHGIWRWWAPPLERSRLATLAYCGSYGGAVLGMPISGFLADQVGWYAPYYFYGCAGIVWYAFWMWLAFEKPCTHPSISPREQLYIEQSIGTSHGTKQPTIYTTPWAKVFTSMPVWAIIVANFARSWTFYLLLITQPKYFKEVFKMSLTEGSTLAALPHLVMTIIVPFGGQLADWLRKKEILSTTNVRKIFNCGGFGGEALFLLVVGYSPNQTVAVIGLILAVGSSGFAISGFNVNHLDIAPRYASILMGISNGVGTLSGMLCPVITEQITKNHATLSLLEYEWSHVFLIASSIHFAGVIFYAIFASGELQPWAEEEKSEKMEMTNPTDNPPGLPGNTGQQYGVASGYSEDYGAVAKPKQPTLDNNQYNATGVYNVNGGTNGASDQQSSAPVNPFTQQQYQEKTSNPFARK